MVSIPIGKNLVEIVGKIDPKLKYEKYFGQGTYGVVLKVTDGSKSYRLKINKQPEQKGEIYTLEREFYTLKSLSQKTKRVPTPIKLYDNVLCANLGGTGANAYLTDHIPGQVLSKLSQSPEIKPLTEIGMEIAFRQFIEEIHQAGYMFTHRSDLNGDNILLGTDGKLYLIDPMFVVPITSIQKEKIHELTNNELFRKEALVSRIQIY